MKKIAVAAALSAILATGQAIAASPLEEAFGAVLKAAAEDIRNSEKPQAQQPTPTPAPSSSVATSARYT